MTDQERDAAAAEGAERAADEDAATSDELDEGEDQDEFDEDEDEDEGLEDDEAAAPAAVGGASTAATGRAGLAGRRLRSQPRTVAAPPSVSERAVRVDDRVSGWYVMAVVGVFALIFANAIFLGHSGFVGGLFPTPTPVVTAAPTLAPSAAAPSAAAPSSAAPSAASSSSAGASPSAAPASSAPASTVPSPS